MHELSIALSIIEIATEEAETYGAAQVSAIHLRLGALSGVVKDALQFAYGLACQDTSLQGSRLVIEDVPTVVYCPSCRADRTLDSLQWFCCPVCEMPAAEVVHGKELEIVALELLQ